MSDRAHESTYFRAVSYSGEQAERRSNRAYTQARDLLYRTREAELSSYRLALPQTREWVVALIGVRPPDALERQLATYLATGEPTTLPEGVRRNLEARRREAEQIGPWVERRRGRG